MRLKNNKANLVMAALTVVLTLQSCRDDEVVVPTEYDLIPEHAVNGQGVQPQLHYSVDGKRVDASQRGLHVVRMQNGHTRKIVVR